MRQKSFWLLLLLGVSLLLVLDCREHDRFRNNKLQSSYYWDLTGFPIFIDDDDPSYNWAITAATKDWCSGSGTWIDPYLIENVTINGQNSGSCIFIRGSSVFFVIKNCSLSNSGNNLPTQDS